eukprot:8657938-Alexandrium_andersonii.AAC.1
MLQKVLLFVLLLVCPSRHAALATRNAHSASHDPQSTIQVWAQSAIRIMGSAAIRPAMWIP